LQYKLVGHVLSRQLKTLTFFFEDFDSKKKASNAFILKILTRLKSQMYKRGETIVHRNEPVRELIIVSKGSINLHGYFTDMRGNEFCTKIVTLPE